MIDSIIAPLRKIFTSGSAAQLDQEVLSYLKNSYPSNHNYNIRGQSLIPSRKLAKRFKVISQLYPQELTSLLDLSSCKGYFVFEAAQRASCQRSVGVDIYEPDLQMCDTVKSYLHADKVTFARLALHELVERINEFGGPFQTILIINLYQYLYFGSDRDPGSYLDHDLIFKMIASICTDRVIFNNRTELTECQNKAQIDKAGLAAEKYSTKHIIDAASKYFHVEEKGEYGRFPLLVMRKR